jgi:hypothetical protein
VKRGGREEGCDTMKNSETLTLEWVGQCIRTLE